MCQYSADNGTMGDWHLAHLGQFSMGGPGLILIEATAVEPAGRISHGCCGLYSDENERGMGRIIEFCNAVGDSKIGIQLAHSGRKGSTERPWEGGRSLKVNEWQTFAPSKIPIKFVTFEVSHAEMFPLNALAPLNISAICVTLPTFQLFKE